MTKIQPLPEMPEQKPRFRNWKIFCALFLLIIIAGAAACVFCPYLMARYSVPQNQQVAQNLQKLTELESRIQSIENRLNQGNAQAAPDAAAAQSSNTASTVEIAHMQSDLVALSAALSALHDEVKQNSSSALQNRQAAQASVAEAIAFIQLRESVDAGRSFTVELAAMREASRNDSGLAEPLEKLEPLAAKGSSTIAALQEQLAAAESSASQAIDKSNAHGWWERILAELRGLVSIRHLHGSGSSDAFADMENALAKGDVAASLDAFKNLPPEAQAAMAEWRARAEDRLNADSALHAIAEHFTASANATPSGEP